jgi:hypothetical protein
MKHLVFKSKLIITYQACRQLLNSTKSIAALNGGLSDSGNALPANGHGLPARPLSSRLNVFLCPHLGRASRPARDLGKHKQSIGFSASPIAGDGKIFLASEDGDVYVIRAGPLYELMAVNPMGETMIATPAISGGMLILRGQHHVFGIGGE